MKRWVAVVLVVFALWIVSVIHETPDERWQRFRDQEREAAEIASRTMPARAYRMAQKFVRERLRAPATAVFPPISEVSIGEVEKNLIFVTGYVDAQNGFGALIREPFAVIMRYEGDSSWRAEAVQIGNR